MQPCLTPRSIENHSDVPQLVLTAASCTDVLAEHLFYYYIIYLLLQLVLMQSQQVFRHFTIYINHILVV